MRTSGRILGGNFRIPGDFGNAGRQEGTGIQSRRNMQLWMAGRRRSRLPLIPLFLAGMLAGGVLLYMGKNILLTDSGFLGEEMLYQMKYMTVDSNAFLWYVLAGRLKSVMIAAVLATTYLGLVTICTMAAWYGMTMGMFITAAITRYGLKGVLLTVVGIFPQYLVYIPAFYFLMLWCERVCRVIYFEKTVILQDKSVFVIKLLQLAGLILAVIAGCMMESYVNPVLLGGLLKIF